MNPIPESIAAADRLARRRSAAAAGDARPDEVPFPDCRNLGVWLRVLLLINGAALAAALVDAELLAEWPERYLAYAWRLQPLLLLSLSLLWLVDPWMKRLPVGLARLCAVAGVVLLTILLEGLWRRLWLSDVGDMMGVLRQGLLAAAGVALALVYLAMRHRAVRPAVDAAQVAALTARIRPHFLFNSLNAVLSLIRKEPQRAEAALESLADLFRVLMRDPRDLVPLSGEISLCRQYLDLERLRLGDRLRVEWAVDDVPGDALVPPLMLQPLLENAVYHGIEPADDGGLVRIVFRRDTRGFQIEIVNTVPGRAARGEHAHGNHMALANIKQRLALHYDLEASLEAEQLGDEYRVRLLIPEPAGRP